MKTALRLWFAALVRGRPLAPRVAAASLIFAVAACSSLGLGGDSAQDDRAISAIERDAAAAYRSGDFQRSTRMFATAARSAPSVYAQARAWIGAAAAGIRAKDSRAVERAFGEIDAMEQAGRLDAELRDDAKKLRRAVSARGDRREDAEGLPASSGWRLTADALIHDRTGARYPRQLAPLALGGVNLLSADGTDMSFSYRDAETGVVSTVYEFLAAEDARTHARGAAYAIALVQNAQGAPREDAITATGGGRRLDGWRISMEIDGRRGPVEETVTVFQAGRSLLKVRTTAPRDAAARALANVDAMLASSVLPQ